MRYYIFEDSKMAGFGGGQKVTLSLVRALAKSGSVNIIDTQSNSDFISEVSAYSHSRLTLTSFKQKASGVANNFSMGLPSFLVFLICFPLNLFRIIRFIKKTGGFSKCILYAPTKKGAVYASMLSRLYGARFFFHAHNCYDSETVVSRIFQNLILSRAVKVIAVSNFVRDSMLVENSATIYNPLTIENLPKKLFDENIMRASKYTRVATCCALLPYKGVAVFLQSKAYLRPSCKVEYQVVGDGPLRLNLESNYGDMATFRGSISDMRSFYLNDVDVLVVPSVMSDAFSLVILEAMHYGILVIATSIGAHLELVHHMRNGILVEPNNPEIIAEWISMIYENPSRWREMRIAGRETADEFIAQNFDHKMLELLR